jgi:hypothetical protein
MKCRLNSIEKRIFAIKLIMGKKNYFKEMAQLLNFKEILFS